MPRFSHQANIRLLSYCKLQAITRSGWEVFVGQYLGEAPDLDFAGVVAVDPLDFRPLPGSSVSFSLF